MQFSIAEDLWFGDATADSQAEQAAGESMVARAARILDLRPLPVAAQRLMTITRNPDYRVSEIEKIILADPSLSARVMRIVNSAALGLRAHCTSVQHAIVILGGRALCDLAFSLVVFGLGQRSDGVPGRVTTHSSAVAVLARQLAMLLGRSAGELFTIGLFHDLGKLLELQLGNESYARLLDGAREADTSHLREREALGYDHAVLAGHILRAWQIPEPLPTAVAWHHQPGRALAEGGTVAELVALTRVANRLAYLLEETERSDDELLAALLRDASAEYLGLRAGPLSAAWHDLHAAAIASRQIFG
jgi:putative nucleotidyltransferase with HDIG domain